MREYLFIVGYSLDPTKFITRIHADDLFKAINMFKEINELDSEGYKGTVSTVYELTGKSYKRTNY